MNLTSLLLFADQAGASDLHISAGASPMVRVAGRMRPVALPGLDPGAALSREQVHGLLYSVLSEADQATLEEDLELDCALKIGQDSRFRVNVFRQDRGLAAVFRVIPGEILTFESLGLPTAVRGLAQRERGLVLVTGPTGSGKSTTLAAMLDWINANQQGHIITLEDPIEFVHAPKKCMINQRQVGSSTHSFANALRSCLREDPDVILIGEMRDLETIALAITAAETGHLVFGTLHTNSAPKTIDRIINVFPASEQPQIRTMLAESLQGVVSQHLLTRNRGGGRIAAHEILISTGAVRAMIREGKNHLLPNAIQTGSKLGMQSLEQSMTRLAAQGEIDHRIIPMVLSGESNGLDPERPADSPPRARSSGSRMQPGERPTMNARSSSHSAGCAASPFQRKRNAH